MAARAKRMPERVGIARNFIAPVRQQEGLYGYDLIGVTGQPIETFLMFEGEFQIAPVSVGRINGIDGKVSIHEQPSLVFWREGDASVLLGKSHVTITRRGDNVILLQGEINWDRQPRQTPSGIEFYVLPESST